MVTCVEGLFSELSKLGVSIAAFGHFSALSFPALKRLNCGQPVKPSTLGRANIALQELKNQLEAAEPKQFKR